jgi:Spy/CpxP family protein refolding chaperone
MMGGWMHGGGMMAGPQAGWGAVRDLSDEQRTRISEITRQFQRQQFELMFQMRGLAWRDADSRDGLDEQAERGRFDAMTALRKQMFENRLEMRKSVEAVLTAQQRDDLRRRRALR